MTANKPVDFIDVDGKCPFGYYQEARARETVEFEDRTGIWIAASYGAASKVLTDEETFPRFLPEEIVTDPKYVRTVATPSFLQGEERLKHHKWWLQLFSPKELRRYRAEIVTAVVSATLDEFADQGKVNLIHQFTEPVADRVIAAVLGLPWQDDEWMAELRRNFDLAERYKASIYLKPEESEQFAEDALAGTYRIDDLLRPFMDKRRENPDDTVMSRILHDEALAGWTEDELYGLARTFFTGGSGTTSVQIGNAVHLMLTTDGLLETLVNGDSELIAKFVEEALRLVPTNHYRSRKIADDVEFEGARLEKGQVIGALIASGNRDEIRYENAAEVDLTRPNPRQHLTFSVGVGACVGSGLARVILQESVGALTSRLKGMRLDISAGEPELTGSMFRPYTPLNLVFDV
ncbi:cytochrome P450 [Rhodococcus globerulus]|uniref:Cytochrome P450 n=1 Tax=Rhodococcus globerulus TaxID=33008 RepID=A0ABU4C5I1_RHOGO|nr:cytochrome P450 [Rhodococcus globerulus]MDV6271448.1 cytochrome P450 [Rhodococcus globerulus]